jgi:uncharacterized OsmC-like protein
MTGNSTQQIRVRATYLHREQVLIETGGGTLVADHSVRLGGDGRGPSAGDLLAMALDSSTVLNLARVGILSRSIVSHSAYRNGLLDDSGPMSSLMYMAEIGQRIDIVADCDEAALAALAAAADKAPVARALTNGLKLNESVVLKRTSGPRRLNEHVNESLRSYIHDAEQKIDGAVHLTPNEPRWRGSASYLGDGVAMIKHDHQPYIASAGGAGMGISPQELLIASLAACTVYFVVHNTGFDEIPFDDVIVDAVATLDPDGMILEIDRVATVTGPVSDEEAAKIEYFANHCYIGETMRRGPRLTRDLVVAQRDEGHEVLSPIAELYAEPTSVPGGGIGCDDGSCCVPQLQSAGAASSNAPANPPA